MSHCFSDDDDADADDDKMGQSIDLTSPRVPQVKTVVSISIPMAILASN